MPTLRTKRASVRVSRSSGGYQILIRVYLATQVVTFNEGPPAALPTTIDAFRFRNSHLDQTAKVIAEYYTNDVSQDWEVAKEQLGPSQAGQSLERFVRLNTKVSTKVERSRRHFSV